jgi:hypothetical protein
MSDIEVLDADVAVIGGGLGGVAAALAACETGARVVLTEPLDRLGGQVTTQGVSALDEHPLVETAGVSRSYRSLREGIRSYYARQAGSRSVPRAVLDNPGGGWVSRLCFEPSAADAVIDELLAPHIAAGQLTVRRGVAPLRCEKRGAVLHAVELAPAHGDISVLGTNPAPEVVLRIRAAVIIDATELGDLLPLSGAPWVTGAEARTETGEPHASENGPVPTQTQSLTWCATLTLGDGTAAPVPRSGGYERWRAEQPFTLAVPDHAGKPRPFRVFADGPCGLPPFWTYRRLRDSAHLGGPEIALLNWGSHDYIDRDLVGADAAARRTIAAEARQLTLDFVNWLQTEVPRDDGGGRGYPEIQLASHALGTSDGLAAAPYVRESRRMLANLQIREQDVSAAAVPHARALTRRDVVGLGWYHLDLHTRVGGAEGMYAESRPFTVPFDALVTPAVTNLIAGAKNIGTTHVTNGAYRVHHVEWAVGEAAGVAAARAAAGGYQPVRLAHDAGLMAAFQVDLASRGVPLAWSTDIPDEHPLAVGLNLLATHAIAGGDARDDLEWGRSRRPPADVLAAAYGDVGSRLGLAPATTPRTWEDAAAAVVDQLTEPKGNL